ncbi:hypothetical protein GCM10009676_09630 [Prauserella halophila]|uniref:AB hydrolase-1 domain-containing protein n=1 Tax=Prauserella halophila TaxID=185641 RepID=A0ABN1W0H7_9PSEU|nr:alpha/beta hydrolase [Prauserella halophila]MCP2235319.1 Pimeloyl-ACP methyl ester carboxylesterase [Prauserella halophila]
MTEWHRIAERDGVGAWAMGTGPTVLTAHGIEDSWRIWTPIAERLARDYRVVALDLPWRPGNDYRWAGDGTPGEWLGHAVDVALEAVGDRQHRLLSHSFGATATFELLAHGHRPTSIVLLAPCYRAPHTPVESLREPCREALRATIRTGLRVGLEGRSVDPDVFTIMQQGLEDRLMPQVFPVFFDFFTRTGYLDLSDVDVPTLVVAGTHDIALTRERADALAEQMPHTTVSMYDHYTHFCHQEQPAGIAAEAAEFLARHAPTGGHA